MNANPESAKRSCVKTRVVLGDRVCGTEFAGIEGNRQPLLGRITATKLQLGVLQIGSLINSISSDIAEEVKDCFTGVGKLKGYQLKLHVKEDVTPVLQPLRRPPRNWTSLRAWTSLICESKHLSGSGL